MENQAVWKYELSTQNNGSLELPLDSQILSVQVQNEIICLWALVNTKETRKEMRTICIRGTGHDGLIKNNNKLKFIDTVQLRNGALVFHIFELIRK